MYHNHAPTLPYHTLMNDNPAPTIPYHTLMNHSAPNLNKV